VPSLRRAGSVKSIAVVLAALVAMVCLAIFLPRADDARFPRQSLENSAHSTAQAHEC
jgi:hypothetical protein